MLHEVSVQTSKHRDFVDITDKVQYVVGPSVVLPVQVQVLGDRGAAS